VGIVRVLVYSTRFDKGHTRHDVAQVSGYSMCINIAQYLVRVTQGMMCLSFDITICKISLLCFLPNYHI
jgi:hypothetical protein